MHEVRRQSKHTCNEGLFPKAMRELRAEDEEQDPKTRDDGDAGDDDREDDEKDGVTNVRDR